MHGQGDQFDQVRIGNLRGVGWDRERLALFEERLSEVFQSGCIDVA